MASKPVATGHAPVHSSRSAGAVAPDPGFAYDKAVIVTGLVNRQDLNDRAARVCELAPRADGRIGIQMLLSPDVRVWIKPDNLELIEFSEQVDDPKYSHVNHDEKTDLRMYLWSTRGAEPIPGVKGVSVSTHTDDFALTDGEKTELLRLGQWGDATTPGEWHDYLQTIKHVRGGAYPRDWYQKVVVGELFRSHGQPTRSGMGNPVTLDCDVDIFALKFPSYRVADNWCDRASMVHGAEYGKYAHNLLKAVFESKHDPEAVKNAGRVMLEKGGLQSMKGNYYNYAVVVGNLCQNNDVCEQRYKKWWNDARVVINKAWDGLGGWIA
tara:strand:- start:200 stop:1171 length:972 start_codon:yes stop_codon:yes gene_type:complete